MCGHSTTGKNAKVKNISFESGSESFAGVYTFSEPTLPWCPCPKAYRARGETEQDIPETYTSPTPNAFWIYLANINDLPAVRSGGTTRGAPNTQIQDGEAPLFVVIPMSRSQHSPSPSNGGHSPGQSPRFRASNGGSPFQSPNDVRAVDYLIQHSIKLDLLTPEQECVLARQRMGARRWSKHYRHRSRIGWNYVYKHRSPGGVCVCF
jgi:hypothetical protein